MGFTTTWTTSSYEFNYPTISLSGAPNAPASVSSSSVLATSTTLSWTWTNSAPSSQPFGSFDGKVCTGSGLTGTCTSFSSTSASLSTAISALSVGTTYYVGVRACGSSVSSATCSAFTTTTFQTQGVRYVTTYSECSACNSTAALLTQTCVTATTSTPTAMVDCQAQPSPASSRSCNPVSDWSLGQCTQDESTSDHGESHCTQSRTRSYTSPDAITNTTSCPLTDTTSCKCGGPNVGTTRASQVSLSKSTTPSSHADVRQTTASATVTLATSGDRLTRSSATPSMPDAASTSVPDAASTPVPDAASTSVALGSVVTSVPGAAVSSPVVAATSTNPESTVASAAISSHTPGVSTALPGEGAPDPSGASSSMSLIGPVVGAVLGVLLLVIVILVVARRRRRQRQSKRSVSSIELMSPRSPRNGVATTDDHIQMMPNELTAPASKKNNTRSKQDDLYATTQDVAWESLYSTTQDVAGDGGLYSSAQDAANHGTYAEVSKSQLADAMKAGPSGEQYATPTSSASVAIGPLGDEYSLVNKSKKSSSAHLVNIGPRGDQYAVVNKTSKSSVSVVTSSDYEELSAAPSATIIGPAGDVYSRPLRGASSSPPEPLYSSPNDQIAAPFDTSGSAVYDRPSDV
ncbi:hypothetical protein CAOG_08206 [Capsaspora owczarzaki ATCC 30864]|nr:hypothetical protein CAOG_08206 [Capsaspora owczarzaki ATCC 30864]|eukprot:XP_004342461.2 hypothetical protein CAOG_08206 [Capsaspora owczarzaki ATCC 30864]